MKQAPSHSTDSNMVEVKYVIPQREVTMVYEQNHFFDKTR